MDKFGITINCARGSACMYTIKNRISSLLKTRSRQGTPAGFSIFKQHQSAYILGCDVGARVVLSSAASTSTSTSMSDVSASSASPIPSLPAHCRMKRNISCRRYDCTSSEALLFLIFSCRRYDRYSVGALLFFRLSLLALSAAILPYIG